MVMKRNRLKRSIKSAMKSRRLEVLQRKREMVKDILSLAGDGELEALEEMYCALGDDLGEQLMNLPPVTVQEIHDKLGLSELFERHEVEKNGQTFKAKEIQPEQKQEQAQAVK